MTTTLDDKLKNLGTVRHKKIEARAAQLIAEEMSLRDLRQAHKYTQESIAKILDISQDGVSRIEKRTDILISTLRKFVEAMGGTLAIVAEFPNKPRIVISGLTDIDEINPSKQKERTVVTC